MGFIEAYKRLERLCAEMLGRDRPVTAYIEEMKAKHDGAYFVPGWEEDMKKLKYYRHIRNQIAHDPGCTEGNLCQPGDARWLTCFYNRILRQEDPLALYRKAKKAKAKSRTSKPSETGNQNDSHTGFPWLLVLLFILAYLIYKFLN